MNKISIKKFGTECKSCTYSEFILNSKRQRTPTSPTNVAIRDSLILHRILKPKTKQTNYKCIFSREKQRALTNKEHKNDKAKSNKRKIVSSLLFNIENLFANKKPFSDNVYLCTHFDVFNLFLLATEALS